MKEELTITGRSRARLDREAFERHVAEIGGRAHAHLRSFDKDRERIKRHASDFSTVELRALQQAFDAADPYAARCRLNTRDEPFTWLHVVGLLLGVALIALGVAL